MFETVHCKGALVEPPPPHLPCCLEDDVLNKNDLTWPTAAWPRTLAAAVPLHGGKYDLMCSLIFLPASPFSAGAEDFVF